MKLYVLRHAEAEPHGTRSSDEARELTERGKLRMTQAARGLRRQGIKLDAILTSPLVRAVQTAAIVAATRDDHPQPQTMLELATGTAPARLAAALAPLARFEQVLIVGHEPQLSALISLLLTGASDRMNLQLKKGGCVALDLPDKTTHRSSELLWMMTPGQLRKLRKTPS